MPAYILDHLIPSSALASSRPLILSTESPPSSLQFSGRSQEVNPMESSVAQGADHVERGAAGDVVTRRRRRTEDYDYEAEIEESHQRDAEEERRYDHEGRDPASRSDMLALPIAKAGETREDECPICLQDFLPAGAGGKEIRTMPCSHSFHQQCIFDWLSIDRRCPICRFVMPSEKRRRRILEEEELEFIEEDDEEDDDEEEDERFPPYPATEYIVVRSFIFDGSRPFNGLYD